MFKIEQSVPVPSRARANGLRSALRDLAASKIGASFFIPKDTYATDSIRGAIQTFGPGWAKTAKVVENGVEGTRVWKIAELPFAHVATKDGPRK